LRSHHGDHLPVTGKLVVVGVGLIGGSVALAARRAGLVTRVVGIGRTAANLDTAVARGVVDVAYTLDGRWQPEVADADVVLVAAPVAQYAQLFAALAPALGSGTIVTDAGSTKADVVAAARAGLGPAIARFVPGHPIAGTEHSGAQAAFAELFDARTVILTPMPETNADALARVAALWRGCGARVSVLEPAQHDAIYAAVSHLPHLAAFAFVAELARRPDAATLLAHAGSGFRDFTRIGASSPEMWRDIALANRAPLLAELDAYRAALDATRAMLAAGDAAGLAAMFASASAARKAWGQARHEAAGGADDEG
jgi:prephenate dehydrogenase